MRNFSFGYPGVERVLMGTLWWHFTADIVIGIQCFYFTFLYMIAPRGLLEKFCAL